MDAQPQTPPAIITSGPLTLIGPIEILSSGTVALTFNADGTITCYKIPHKAVMQLPTDALVAYLALCEKPRVKWASPHHQ